MWGKNSSCMHLYKYLISSTCGDERMLHGRYMHIRWREIAPDQKLNARTNLA